MRVMVKRPFGEWEERDVDNSDAALQELIGGVFDEHRLFSDVVLLERRAPLMQGLSRNVKICGRPFYGTVVAVGTNGEERVDFPVPLTAWRMLMGRKGKSGK